jgi:TetR/AcrR family tetracycline transcriptional repressor
MTYARRMENGVAKPRGRPKVPLLSKNKILQAALELVDERGLDNFSVQMVADRFGVTAPSVYHYFADREDLLRGVGLLVYRQLREVQESAPVEERPRPWAEWVREYARAIYVAVHQHPNVVPILLARKTRRDAADLFDVAVADLERGGLNPNLALTALDATEAIVLAWCVFDDVREENWGFGPLPPGEFQKLASVVDQQASAEERLSECIEALVAGFATLNAIRPRTPAPIRRKRVSL